MTRHKRSNTRTSSSVAGAIHLGAAILSVAANLRRRCRFRRLFLTTDCVHQHLISAFLLHAPPAFPCLVSLLCSLAHHLQPKGPLDEVSASSIKGWLQDAVNSKKPVLILFAPAGHSLIEQLGKGLQVEQLYCGVHLYILYYILYIYIYHCARRAPIIYV